MLILEQLQNMPAEMRLFNVSETVAKQRRLQQGNTNANFERQDWKRTDNGYSIGNSCKTGTNMRLLNASETLELQRTLQRGSEN